MNGEKVVIPFRKEVDLTDPKDWIAIDINESNITGVSSNPHVIRIEHGLRTIHTTYFEIRRRIQKLSKYKRIISKRLMRKYSGREKKKSHDLCHKIAKIIVDFAKEHGFGILAPNGHRLMKYQNCGYENDRDVIACLNIRMRGVPVPPECLSMKSERGRLAVTECYSLLRSVT